LAGFALCDLPSVSRLNLDVFQPGLFLQGPEEKYGLLRFVVGFDSQIGRATFVYGCAFKN